MNVIKAHGSHKSDLYREEYEHIFSKKAHRVRGAAVTAAFVEGQVVLLAGFFLDSHPEIAKPKKQHEFYPSLQLLENNRRLNDDEIRDIKDFWKERNITIHGVFKGMTRPEWVLQNNKVVDLGRPIVKLLDEKLAPFLGV